MTEKVRWSSIGVHEETRERIREHRENKEEYDQLLNRILDVYEVVKKIEV